MGNRNQLCFAMERGIIHKTTVSEGSAVRPHKQFALGRFLQSLPGRFLLFVGPVPGNVPPFFTGNAQPLERFAYAVSQQLNSTAISFGYASGCSCTYVFGLGGSIFLYPRTTGVGASVPFSFHCFSHARIVLIDTLNTSCVSSSVCLSPRYSIVRFR